MRFLFCVTACSDRTDLCVSLFSVREPWFDTLQSFNPAIHRVKQAMFHSAVVKDVVEYPVPPPHPDTTKYFEPPKRVLKRAREPIEECKKAFKVKEG